MRRLDKTLSEGTSDEGVTLKGVRRWRSTLIWVGLLVIIGVVVSVFLDSRSGMLHRLPVQWIHMSKAVLVLIIGAMISHLLERGLFRFPIEKLGPQRSTMVRYLTRLLLFTVITVAVLTAFGVGVPSVIFGGTFLTVIIGLAGQTIFANIIGGIWLIFVRPFRIGDYIGIVAWQFPLLMPSFPHEATRPTYYGRVEDINLMYTKILNRDGYPQLIPNGIIAQSFLENRTHEGAHRVHLRFDVAFEVDSVIFMGEFRRRLEAEFPVDEGSTEGWTTENEGGQAAGAGGSGVAAEAVSAPVEVTFADVYPTAYSVAVNIHSREKEEWVRNRVLALAVQIIQELRPGTDPKFALASNSPHGPAR
ncbi:small-conductance mechanosensitive channel [Peptococcaceae bacterium CEB3]|nr:small-conductance mechanosensitive channel [Peptococcaceae bacterium CEB3]